MVKQIKQRNGWGSIVTEICLPLIMKVNNYSFPELKFNKRLKFSFIEKVF